MHTLFFFVLDAWTADQITAIVDRVFSHLIELASAVGTLIAIYFAAKAKWQTDANTPLAKDALKTAQDAKVTAATNVAKIASHEVQLTQLSSDQVRTALAVQPPLAAPLIPSELVEEAAEEANQQEGGTTQPTAQQQPQIKTTVTARPRIKT